ncbi:MAG: hypothetical protein ISR82_07135 [Candidatus Marinimicrobia bacterium]|nr:hypothetical protein [Candidatus Neomarinimicrobiota bacterium]MBL7010978.1 hypothetical protein [Candidatus Neomarinimicrobiota bacterium]MBL7031122.1 hypothetical protein [Candidatus Neomarinimicrobiota bacterium]
MNSIHTNQDEQLNIAFVKSEQEIPLSLQRKLESIPLMNRPFEKIYNILNGIGVCSLIIFLLWNRLFIVNLFIELNTLFGKWIQLMSESPIGLFGIPISFLMITIISYGAYRLRDNI